MSRILFRYVLRTYVFMFVGILASVLAIFLVVDFVDRARSYIGPGWVSAAGLLYSYKALVAIHQLGPAALLLAAGTTVALIQRRGELTAIGALALGPGQLLAPIAVGAAVLCGGLTWFGESVAINAAWQINEISATRFNRWTVAGSYYAPQRWFHRGDYVFYLRAGDADRGFDDVTLLELDSQFRLTERIDAQHLVYLDDNRWRLSGVVDRTFAPDGSTHVQELSTVDRDLGTSDRPFRIRIGAPEQMRLPQLREQIRARRAAGLDTGPFSLAMHNRIAYPFTGLPAALLAALLAFRTGRKTTLAATLAEGVAIGLVLWTMMVIFRTLVMAQHVPAGIAAWAPLTVLALAAGLLWLHREGRLLPRKVLAPRSISGMGAA